MSEMTGVTIQQLEQKIKLYHEQKDAVEQAEAEVERRKKEMDNTGAWLQSFMDENQKTSYKSTWGTLVLTTRYSVGMPKDPQKRTEFFSYLRDKGLFENMITVNHQTLNSYYKQEMEAALDKGDIDFKVPGIEEPSAHKTITLRKK